MDLLSTCLDDLEPTDLGLPERFTSFRQAQREIADFGVYGLRGKGDRMFAGIGAPTGVGKSLAGQAIGKLFGGDFRRYATLTATVGLQDQISEDFGSCGLVDIRGRSNYECVQRNVIRPAERWSCEDGYEKFGCYEAGSADCTYGRQVAQAKAAQSISSNYQFWMHSRAVNRATLGDVELLICDEAHKAVEEVARFLGVYIGLDEFVKFGGSRAKQVIRDMHKEWGMVEGLWPIVIGEVLSNAKKYLGQLRSDYENERDAMQDPDYRKQKRLCDNLDRLEIYAADGNWIWQQSKTGRGLKFDCIWPYRYCGRFLFGGVNRVVLMSATLRPKCFQLLGIKKTDIDFKEWPRVFPGQLSPVYWYEPNPKTPLKMGKGVTNEDLNLLASRVDEIVSARQDRRTLVHTSSYKLAQELQARSKFGRRMLINERGTESAKLTAAKFRTAPVPALLVSPSYGTGWDFMGSACEVNIIAKLPFVDRSNPVAQARESDPQYGLYVTMQDVVQACGRGSRHESDRCETFILDGNVRWFQWAAKEHAPRWFTIREIGKLPKCPPKMEENESK